MQIEKFETTHDFELIPNGSKRKSKYKICSPSSGKGLVVYIPGFGADLGGYTESFCEKISQNYERFTAMSVDYFCMKSRPEIGAKISFEVEDRVASNTTTLREDEIIPFLLNKSKTSSHVSVFNAGLNPPEGEYQNFGLMAAIDIINACNHAIKKFDLDENNIILIGSSYGGYIANLVTKIAPGLIRAVFDNSSWAKVNLSYVVGRELMSPEYRVKLSEKLFLNLFVKSPWTLKSSLPNSLSNEKLAIRNFDKSDLTRMKSYGGDRTCYLFYHAVNDTIADTKQKMTMARNMIELGFMVSMEVFEEQDVDGKFIKSLNHGMGLSMLSFFEKGMNFLDSVKWNRNGYENKCIEYKYNKDKYIFDLNETPLIAKLISD